MKRVNIKCPYCRSQAFLRPASVVYGQGHSEPNTELYVCARYPICDAYVAAHHHILWQSGLMTKRAAYRWLQVQLGLPAEEAHIANFSEWRCDQVIQLCGRFLAPHDKAA